jgi:hypothetical protein
MLLWIGLGILYFILLFTLGMMSLRNGDLVMFLLGFSFPVLWLVGAVIAPTEAARKPGPVGSSQVR